MNDTHLFPIRVGEGRLQVEASGERVGDDVHISVFGGSRPHIGAVALACPCPENREGVRTFASVLCAPGHRDDLLAHALALRLCKATGRVVCLTVGLHVDAATDDDIQGLVRNAEAAAEALLPYLFY